MRHLCLFAALTGSACTSDKSGDSGPGAAAETNGLPEGDSTWEGTIEVSGIVFPFSLELTNSGGDLSGAALFEDHPDTPLGFGSGRYTLTGTHEPGSGLVAMAPGEWLDEPDIELELLGFSGVYDADTDAMTGMAADYASGSDNALVGGPASLTRTGGSGAPTAVGARAAALPTDTRSFSGTYTCTSSEREVAGELTYDGAGALTGTVSFGDLSLAESTNTFAVTGVHNPSTGGVTLIPGLYSETDRTFATFFVEATYDPAADAFAGGGRVNVGPCPTEAWLASF